MLMSFSFVLTGAVRDDAPSVSPHGEGRRGEPELEIIPVIDLKKGLVVRARQGQRDQYRPIESPLSPTSDPVDVVSGLVALHPFQTLYVADLDAIEVSADNDSAIARVKAAFPALSLMVDNGVRALGPACAWLAKGWGHLVIGSESQSDLKLLGALSGDGRTVLSLDFRGDAFQGPPELLAHPTLWPERVIAMTLARVGSGAGPDIDRLAALRDTAPQRKLYAAGGVRDFGDIETLARARISGALVASSLHDGRLSAQDIAKAQSL
jgi:phosphoribosylformimino-5-aminoimidazole carboxamide ribotide isomerase